MAIRTHHVHHVARDPQVAANFYIQHFDGKLFTPQIEYKGAPYISVLLGEVEIRIRGMRENETGQDTPVDIGLHHFGIEVDNMEEITKSLDQAGVEFTKRPGDGVLGSTTAFIKAPDNVLIELVQEPDEN